MRIITVFIYILFILLIQVGQAQELDYFKDRELKPVSQVFPNPATDLVNILFAQEDADQYIISIRNVIGGRVHVDMDIVNNKKVVFKIKELPVGYYFIILQQPAKGYYHTRKFLKR